MLLNHMLKISVGLVMIIIPMAPIVIGIYFIFRAFSAPKKKRIIYLLVTSFALAGYIIFIEYCILPIELHIILRILHYLALIIVFGAPIAIGIYFIFRAFSAPKKKRIIYILVTSFSFALAGYISYYCNNILFSVYCGCCDDLVREELHRVKDAVWEYFNKTRPLTPEEINFLYLNYMNGWAESAGYGPPADRKSSLLNPCVQESDLSVHISGDYSDYKILVYVKERNCGSCGKKAYSSPGGWFLSKEQCAYLDGEGLKNYNICK